MISEITVYAFCIEEPSLIENYDKAIADKNETWVCHHRNEITLNKTQKELQKLGMYFHRPASELIFITKGEHTALHNKFSKRGNKYSVGRKHSDEELYRMSESMKGKHTGEKHPMYNRHHSEESKMKNSISNSKQYKWLTPTGEIKLMNRANAKHYHPDWKEIGEA